MNVTELFSMKGRAVLVTGGGGGIGAAIAAALAGAGGQVAISGRDQGRLDAAAEAVRGAGGACLTITADATREADCERAVAAVLDRYGRLDGIVNAVGGGAGKALFPAEAYPREAWDWIFELNVRSTVVATQAAARALIAGGRGGHVLNILSVRAQLGINAGYSAYVAAKGALASLTRQWATEWARHRVNVNAISPTFVDTPQVASLLADPKFKGGLESRIPLGRVARTDDVVGAALYFLSDASSYVTGQILTIDGGLTATQ